LGAKKYINTIGGTNLYANKAFSALGTDLNFIIPKPLSYQQFNSPFVPWLSIVDVMMFNSIDQINLYLMDFELVTGEYNNG
jgi:hypothetical protein